MGRHNIFSASGPRPARVRFAVSRAAAITLVLAVIAWVCLSIVFAPPDSGEQLLSVDAIPAEPATTDPLATVTTGPAEQESITVHVVGEVKHPGVYVLAPGARVNDAIEAAGGMSTEARPELLNLASPVVDGQQILLPGPQDPSTDPPPDVASADSAPSIPDPGQGRININQADAETLSRLPGIGPALAGRIIDFRESNGPFSSAEELEQVSGIGPVLVKRLRDLVQAP